MRYEEAYANVPVGLTDAPEHLRSAYQSKFSRYIIEALLIDSTTPVGVFTDLLGWTAEDIEAYKKYFFCIDPDMPRLKLYEFICSAPEATEGEKARKNMLVSVFEFGWSYIDSKYNRSNRLMLAQEVEAGVKKMFGGLHLMVEQCMRRPTATSMRALVAFMKEGMSTVKATEIEQSPVEALTFDFVDNIQNEVKAKVGGTSKIMNIEFDPLMRLKAPEGEEKKELEQIIEDVGK